MHGNAGFKRIKDILEKEKLSFPEIESDTFCRVTFKRPVKFIGSERIREKTGEKTREKIISLIKENKYITTEELADKTSLSIKGIEWNIQQMKAKKMLKRIGPDKGGYWKV